MSETATRPHLVLRGVTKRFGDLLANDAIDLAVAPGEIVALLGENGAGKTTLMNILFGHYVADEGMVSVTDSEGVLHPLAPGSPEAALKAGIGMVHQHFALADNLTGFENIVLGTRRLLRWSIAAAGERAAIDRLMAETGLQVDLDTPVGALAVGERQRIEVLKALHRNAKVLVLDEPTAVLTPQEVDGLFVILRRLAGRGLSILFISHKMAEVLALADRVVVLRGGRKVADRPAAGADSALLAELMVGYRPAASASLGKTEDRVTAGKQDILILSGVSAAGLERAALRSVDLALRPGEILGIAGIAGNGQSTLAHVIAGMLAPRAGTISLAGQTLVRHTPAARIAAGIGRIPEDRHRHGAVGGLSVAENLIIEARRQAPAQRFGFLRRGAIARQAETAIDEFDVRCPGPQAPIRLLSGGNMQKVILARALSGRRSVILAHQPTRGLDVKATADIHHRLREARAHGAGVIVISEDLDELFALCDRIAVMHGGAVSAPAPVASLTVAEVGLMMAGEFAGAA